MIQVSGVAIRTTDYTDNTDLFGLGIIAVANPGIASV